MNLQPPQQGSLSAGVTPSLKQQQLINLSALAQCNSKDLTTLVGTILGSGRSAASSKVLSSFKGNKFVANSFLFLHTLLTEVASSPKECGEWIPYLLVEGDVSKYKETFALLAKTTGVCGKTWIPGQVAFKCRTCEKDPTCAICQACFLAGNHQGHDCKY